ncbi:MAG: DUF2461 family protein [Anaerolineae bacterium]
MFEEYELPDSAVFHGFEPDTFAFLSELAANNTLDWMNANEERYHRVLREPLRMLFKSLAPVALRLNHGFETEPKFGRVLSSIRRRWLDNDQTYYDYLWGAFYRASRSRHTDAQLFVSVHSEGIRIGAAIPEGAADLLEAFKTRRLEHADSYQSIIEPLEQAGWQIIEFDEYLHIQREYHADDEIVYRPELADEISRHFERLYPLYRFLIGEDTAPLPPARQPDTLQQVAADTLLTLNAVSQMVELLRDKGQIVLYGPPGTGKTFIARRLAQHIAGASGDIRTVQFHPSYAYEEFIEGIRPQSDGGQISYPVQAGVFKRLCEDASQQPQRQFILIIDEINRGNLPRIFGELLYLLEYRDSSEAVTLPYSKTQFSIPRNVYLIGTMNAADRTLTALDQAVRRRFHFIPLKPDPEILRRWLRQQGNERMAWATDLLATLNQRLEEDGFDWHRHFGHTVFMVRGLDERRLRLIWEHSILPALEDYFYNREDWQSRYDFAALRGQISHV